MFTGLIEEIGKIKSIQKGNKSIVLSIEAHKVLEDVKLGDSIATNGICLTVTEYTSNNFKVDVMPETMSRSSFNNLKVGDKVNLERALKVGDRLGGHMVSGHIDNTGSIVSFNQDDNAIWITISSTPDVLRYIIEKGSIAIDGVSLTVAYVDDKEFKVSVIPHTKDETTLAAKPIGSLVNLECDLTAKYIEKFIKLDKEEPKKESKVNMDFLRENGFL